MAAELIIDTLCGTLRGTQIISSDGIVYCAFKGIPYAQPPVGELRFRDPVPKQPWSGILDATKHGQMCAQYSMVTNSITGGDDCLYLNIYVRTLEPGQKLPVMVWIHGGGFVHGSGDSTVYGPDYFMQKDVVLVTINYRVGVFGFLNLEEEGAMGNQGLKDQVMALRWIRDNIAKFTGDPENVTVFGESAGGASAHYLAISPLSKGLFHKVICQSGVAISPWAFHPDAKRKVYHLAEALGHKNPNSKSMLDFLKTVDAHKLVQAQETLLSREEKYQFKFTFGPSIDSRSQTPFMPVHPEKAANEGIHIPMMIGHTSREGVFLIKEIGQDLSKFNTEFVNYVHPNAEKAVVEYGLSPENLKRLYLRNDPITERNVDKLIDLLSDLYIVDGVHKVIKRQVEKSTTPTFYYQFSYDRSQSLVKLVYNTDMSGASHADDLQYLFRPHIAQGKIDLPRAGSEPYKITCQMIELWVNFATTGRPTPKTTDLIPLYWQPVNDDTVLRYMNICEDLRVELGINLAAKLRNHRLHTVNVSVDYLWRNTTGSKLTSMEQIELLKQGIGC